MPDVSIFIAAALGAAVIYVLRFKVGRVGLFFQYPAVHWRTLAFDVGVFMICGILVVAYVVQPDTDREAFLGGATWLAFVSNVPTR